MARQSRLRRFVARFTATVEHRIISASVSHILEHLPYELENAILSAAFGFGSGAGVVWRDNAIPACRRMKAGMTFESISEDGFGIAPVLRVLAGTDLNRGLDVAKSFKRDGPRAVAILAIASAILERPRAQNREP